MPLWNICYWTYNKSDETQLKKFSYSNTAFVIGNGTSNENRSIASERFLFDGTTTIAGNVTAASFIGDGSQLTNLSFSNLE